MNDKRSNMKIDTTRFGCLDIAPDDLLQFPAGLLGLEDCRHWVLLADAEHSALGWLQSTLRPEIAFAVVCPEGLCRSIRCGFCAANCRRFA